MWNIAGLFASPAQQESCKGYLVDDNTGDQSQDIERMEEGKQDALTLMERIKARILGYLVVLLGYAQTASRAVSASMALVYMACVSGPLRTAAHWFSVVIGWIENPLKSIYTFFWDAVFGYLPFDNPHAELHRIKASCVHLEKQKDTADKRLQCLQDRYDELYRLFCNVKKGFKMVQEHHATIERSCLEQEEELFNVNQQSLGYQSQIRELQAKKEALLDCIGQEVSRRGRTVELVFERDSLIGKLKLEALKQEDKLRQLEQAQAKAVEKRLLLEVNCSNLASQLRKLGKDKAKLETQLASAKEDVDWYETQSIQQQDLIRRLRRDLGVARDLERMLRKENAALRQENSSLQADHSILLDENKTIQGDLQRLGEALEITQRDYRTDLERIKTYYKDKLSAAQVAHDGVVAIYRKEQEDLAEDARKRHEQYKDSLSETRRRIEEEDWPRQKTAAVISAREAWKAEFDRACTRIDAEWEEHLQIVKARAEQRMNHLQAANGDLQCRLEEFQNGFDKRVEAEIVKRLSDQPLHASTDSGAVGKLKRYARDLEAQLATDRQEHQNGLTAAIREGWAMSSDEKVAAISEERDRLEAECLQICEERDGLLVEQDKYEEHCALQADKIEECEAKLVALQRAHDKVFAAQDATLAANNEHKRNLEMANKQVENLVDQVFELEEELKAIKAAQKVAQQVARPPPRPRDTRAVGETTGPQPPIAELPARQQGSGSRQVGQGEVRQGKPEPPLRTEIYRLPECQTPPIPRRAHPPSPSPIKRAASRTMGIAKSAQRVHQTTTTTHHPARLLLQSAANRVNAATRHIERPTKAGQFNTVTEIEVQRSQPTQVGC